jgi:Putative bacterial sensory transduction regulator
MTGAGRHILAAAIALSCLASSVAAAAALPVPRWNPKAPENGQVLPGFNYTTVETVLASIGARFQRTGKTPDKPSLHVTFPNGHSAALVLSACDPAGRLCKALTIQSWWDGLKAVPADRTAQATVQFNERYAFAKAFVAADGRPSLQRYLTADYGFVRGNLAVNLLVFADQAKRFAGEVLQPLVKTKAAAQTPTG